MMMMRAADEGQKEEKEKENEKEGEKRKRGLKGVSLKTAQKSFFLFERKCHKKLKPRKKSDFEHPRREKKEGKKEKKGKTKK